MQNIYLPKHAHIHVCLEIVSGTYTISGGTITGEGDYSENVAAPPSGSLEDGSGIVLRTTDSYSGNIALTISGTAKIVSEKGVAIRNYVRDSDLSSKTFSVEIKESAKIEGTAVAVANQKYTGETPAFTKSTFTLSGGNYLAPSYAELLVGEPKVQYAENHAMSDTPVKDGYYAPVEIKKQESSASTSDEGKTVTTKSGATITIEDTVVTITATGDTKVNLILTYPEGAMVRPSSTGVSSDKAPETVTAEYNRLPYQQPPKLPQQRSSLPMVQTFLIPIIFQPSPPRSTKTQKQNFREQPR